MKLTKIYTQSIKIFLLTIILLNNSFESAGQTIRYQNSVQGGFTIAGNSLVLNKTSAPVFINNSGGIKTSSYSDLILPPGSTVVKAILYVEGWLNWNTGLTSAKFKVPGGAYVTLNSASPGFIATTKETTAENYAQFIIDVTSLIPANGYVSTLTPGGNAGTAGRYCVADPAPLDSGGGNYGYGWSLYVVYTNPSPTTKFRNVTIADGCKSFDASISTSLNIPNIAVPSCGTVNAVAAVTGCWGEPGSNLKDEVRLGKTAGTLTALVDPTGGTNDNALNATIGFGSENNVTADGGPSIIGNYTGRNPYNTFGASPATKTSHFYDSDIFNASGILLPSPTPISVTFQQKGIPGNNDVLGSGAYAVSVDIVPAVMTVAISPTTASNVAAIYPGCTAIYTYTISNTTPCGTNLSGISFTDILPSGIIIANPNGITISGGTGGTVTGAAGGNTVSLSGLSLAVGQTATITVNVTNAAGQSNLSCGANPAAFTHTDSNISVHSGNLVIATVPQCLIVASPPVGVPATRCGTGTVDLSITGCSGTVNWYTAATGGSSISTANPFTTPSISSTTTYYATCTVGSCESQRIPVIATVNGPSALATTTTNSSCGLADGCVNLGAVTGGVTPYTYSFNGSAFTPATSYCSLAAGTYTIIVKDANGCAFTTTATVVDTSGPTAIATTITNSNCGAADGCVTLGAVTGGVPSYTYSFNGSPFTATTSYCSLLAGTFSIIVKDASGCTYATSATVVNNPGPTAIAITVADAHCGNADGCVNLGTVTGGTGPYTYSFNGLVFTSITSYCSLAAGSYPIVVKDANGCIVNTTATVNDIPGPTAIASIVVNSSCGTANGSITLGPVTGGVAPYTYSFAGSFYTGTVVYSNLAANGYIVIVKDVNGCTFNTTINVIDNAGVTAIATTIVGTTCGAADGCITLGAVTGGTAPYTYSFQGGGFTGTTNYCGLVAGSYTIGVKDNNGCIYNTSVTIIDKPGPTAIVTTVVNTNCGSSTGCINIGTVTGGTSPYTYSFNGSAFAATTSYCSLIAGSYSIAVKDNNGCIYNTSITVSDNPEPTAIATTIINTNCSGSNGCVTLGVVTGGTAPYTYDFNGTGFSAATNYCSLVAGSYPIIVKDANGCLFNTSVTVIDNPGPTAIATTIVNANCGVANGCITLGAVTGGTSPYTYNFNGTGFSAATNYCSLAAGSYPIIVKDANGCLYNISATLIDNPGPTAIATTVVNSSCGAADGCVTLGTVTGGTAPYTYDFNGTGYSATTNYCGLVAGSYPIIVKDANGCLFNTSVTVINNSGPTAVTTVVVNSSCGAADGCITIGAVTGGLAPYLFSFNSPSAYGSTTNYCGLLAGTYTIYVKDANGCVYNTTATVIDNLGPTAIASTIVNSSCGATNGCVTLGAVTGGTAPYTYDFNGLGYAATTNYCSLSAGTYSVNIKDANGCIYNTSVTVIDNPGPTAIVMTIVNASCGASDGCVTLGTVTGGIAAYTYSFNGSAFTSTTNYCSLAAGSYPLEIKDANGCIYQTNVSISNNGGPTALPYTQTDEKCGNADGSITLGSVVGGVAPYTYTINGNPTVLTTHTGLTAGNYAIEVKDANGCIFAINVVITNAAGPTAIVTNIVNENCGLADGSVALGPVTGGTPPYEYAFPAPGTYTTTAFYNGLAAGTYNLDVRDANGCIYSTTITITDLPGPTAVVTTIINENCGTDNGAVTFGAITGGTAPYTISFGGSLFTSMITYSSLSAGTYPYIIKDANGCEYNNTLIITDTPGPTDVAVTIGDEACGAANGSITLGAVTGGTAPYTYALNTGTYNTVNSWTGLTAAGSPYTIHVKDANGCIYDEIVNVLNSGGPTATVVTQIDATCGAANGSVNFGTVTGGTAPYTYAFPSPGTFIGTTAYTGLAAGTYPWQIKDANGCIFSGSVTITNAGGPTDIVITSINETCGAGNGSVTCGNVMGGTAPYTISFNGGTFSPTTVFSNLAAGCYTVDVKDANGCIFTDNVCITDLPGPTAIATITVNESCSSANGCITLGTVTGGTSPFTYNFNGTGYGSATNYCGLSAGTYTIDVKDANGCIYSTTVNITDTPGPTAIAVTTIDAACGVSDGCVTFGAVTGGVAPYTYNFNSGGYQPTLNYCGLAAGSYTLIVKDANGCTYTTSVSISNAGGATAVATTTVNETCTSANGCITLGVVTGGTAPYTYNIGFGYTSTTVYCGLSAGTYPINVKDVNGCIYSTSIIITDAPAPTAIAATIVDSTCGNANGSITINGVTNGTAPYTYNLDGGAFTTATNYPNLAAGSHTIIVKDANGCTFTQSYTLTTTVAPTVAISYPGSPFCNLITAVQPVTITGTGVFTGGAYSAIPTGLIYDTATGGVTPFGSAPGTYNMTYTIPATGGCPAISANASVTITAALSPIISCGTPTTNSVQFNWTAVTGATNYNVSYQINGGTAVNVGLGNVLTYSVTGLSPGDSVQITVAPTGGAGSCLAPGTFSCTASNCPAASANISYVTPFCISNTPQSVTLTGTGSYIGGTYDATGGLPINPATGEITPNISGTYTVNYFVASNGGCPAVNASTSVTINALPVAMASPSSQTICSGSTTDISLLSTITGTTFTWTVVENNVTGATNGSGNNIAQTLTATTSTAGTATYIITPMANGCAGSPITVIITVNEAPVATATPTAQSICSGQATGITLTSNLPGTTYSWTFTQSGATGASNGTGNVISQVLTATGTGLGTVTYTIIPTGSSCVGAPINVTVTVAPPPTATATATPSVICSGSTTNIVLAGSIPGTTFTWNAVASNVLGASTGTGNVIAQTLSTVGTSAGEAVYVITPSMNGCPGTPVTVTITVKPNPTVTANPTMQILCSGETTGISLSSNVPGTIFSWTSLASAGITGNSAGTGNLIVQTLSITGSVQGTVDYIITPIANGCPGNSMTVTVTVKPKPEVFGSSGGTICSGATTGISLTPTIPGTTTFAWTVAQTGVTGGFNGTGSIIAQVLETTGTVSGTATYTVIPTANGCQGNPINIIVIVNPLPMPTLTDGIICIDQSTGNSLSAYTLDTGLSNSTYDFVWYHNNVIIPSEVNSTLDASQLGIYTVQVTNTASGCVFPAGMVTAAITESYPGANIAVTASAAFTYNPVITVNVSPASPNYLYSLDDGPLQELNVFTPVSPGVHTIQVTDINGCTGLSANAFVIGYPHYFTPNGDGINDTWNIIGLEDPNTKIYIFDRYGKLIKQISPTGTGWDGTYNGEVLPSTDYWFTVDYVENGGNKLFKAHFSLKR